MPILGIQKVFVFTRWRLCGMRKCSLRKMLWKNRISVLPLKYEKSNRRTEVFLLEAFFIPLSSRGAPIGRTTSAVADLEETSFPGLLKRIANGVHTNLSTRESEWGNKAQSKNTPATGCIFLHFSKPHRRRFNIIKVWIVRHLVHMVLYKKGLCLNRVRKKGRAYKFFCLAAVSVNG